MMPGYVERQTGAAGVCITEDRKGSNIGLKSDVTKNIQRLLFRVLQGVPSETVKCLWESLAVLTA